MPICRNKKLDRLPLSLCFQILFRFFKGSGKSGYSCLKPFLMIRHLHVKDTESYGEHGNS